MRQVALLVSFLSLHALLVLAGNWDNELHFEPFCVGTEQCKRFDDGTVRLQAEENKMGAFKSNGHYVYGVFTTRMKMPKDYSGGLVTCFYLTSNATADYREDHDEIDFEFFGGKSPREILINTNLLSQGQQFNEQYTFPFDPSLDFHNYTLYWGPDIIAWAIDGRPVRITKRQPGKPFVGTSPMRAYGSIWDSSSWSELKSNYSNGPVSMHYSDFDIRACSVAGPEADVSKCVRVGKEKKKPWNKPFSRRHLQKMQKFRKRHVTLSIPWVPIPPPYIPPPEVDYNSTSSENGTYAAQGSTDTVGGDKGSSKQSGGGSGKKKNNNGKSKKVSAKSKEGKKGGEKNNGSNRGSDKSTRHSSSTQSSQRSSKDEGNSEIEIRLTSSSSRSDNNDEEESDSEGVREGENLDSVSGSSIRSIGGNMYTINSDGSMLPAEERR